MSESAALAAVESQQFALELRERLPAELADLSIREVAKCRQDHENWEKRFGEVVRAWRLHRNWSQEELAERLRHQGFEMHQTTIAKIERGSRPLRVAEASAIGAVFKMPPLAIFELAVDRDASWWSVDSVPEQYRARLEELEDARRASDAARDSVYAAAERFAHLAAKAEKIALAMNDQAAKESRDGTEA